MATILELAQKMQRGEAPPPPIGRLLGFVLKEIEPALKGKLIAEAKVIRAGKNLGYVECDVKDGEGKLVARAASTCMRLREARPTT